MGTLLLGVGGTLAVLIVLKAAQFFGKTVQAIYRYLGKIFFWNFFIRYIFQSVIKFQVAAGAAVLISWGSTNVGKESYRRLTGTGEEEQAVEDKTVAVSKLILVATTLIPLVFGTVLCSNSKTLKEDETRARIGSMYQTIQPVSAVSLTYPIVFLLRRTAFVAITFLLIDYPAVQVQLQVCLTIMYLVYIQHFPVFDGPLTRHVEFVNETLFLLINYHLIVFTQGWLLPQQFGKFTWSLVAITLLLLFTNFVIIIRE